MSAERVRAARALLSTSDRSGLAEFAAALAELGIELVSTGGTGRALREAGLQVTEVAEVTGFPEMMDGRVKSLHPRIHGGLLGLRDNAEHMATLESHGIAPFELVCVNLYPFEQAISRPSCTLAEGIENIDIGGPAMLRSAAKNHASIYVVSSPGPVPGDDRAPARRRRPHRPRVRDAPGGGGLPPHGALRHRRQRLARRPGRAAFLSPIAHRPSPVSTWRRRRAATSSSPSSIM